MLQELDVDGRVGLYQQGAQRRLERYGYNELESAQAASPLTLLLGQFRNILIIVLLAAAGLSTIVGEVIDAMIILIIVFFSALLGFFQEYRAERSVEALNRMLAPTARVLRDGEPVVVSARELVPGDIMLLEAGDRVSADVRLLEAHAFRRILCDTKTVEVTGAGYYPDGDLRLPDGLAPDDRTLQLLLRGGVLCNDSELVQDSDQWTIRRDPTEGAFLVLAEKAGVGVDDNRAEHARTAEVPFSSERKRMTTIHRRNGETVAFMKGAPEVILEHCSCIADGDRIRDLGETERGRILKLNEAMATDALRVLGLAYRGLEGPHTQSDEELESQMVFLGLVGMMDSPRRNAAEAVAKCTAVGIRTVMITGDHQVTATAVAREIGIHREGDLVVNGEELGDMSEDELEDIVERVSVYARVSPMDKLKIIRAWKAKRQVVAMTGDGVNDAPALKHADIGVAMGIAGTDVAREAADMVLADDNFATIVNAVQQGRWIFDNIKKYLAYLLESNIAEVVVIGGIVLLFGPELMPLLPAAILYLNLATDGLPALALGVAPADPDIMDRPPRPPDQSVFDWEVKSFIMWAVMVLIPVYSWIFFSHLDDLEYARTMLFFMFVAVEFVIALNCRSLVYSIFAAPPHKWLIIALAWELVIVALIVQIPAVRQAFGITLPALPDLALICAICVMVMFVIEAIKVRIRRHRQTANAT